MAEQIRLLGMDSDLRGLDATEDGHGHVHENDVVLAPLGRAPLHQVHRLLPIRCHLRTGRVQSSEHGAQRMVDGQ